jgi:hypothetical protein
MSRQVFFRAALLPGPLPDSTGEDHATAQFATSGKSAPTRSMIKEGMHLWMSCVRQAPRQFGIWSSCPSQGSYRYEATSGSRLFDRRRRRCIAQKLNTLEYASKDICFRGWRPFASTISGGMAGSLLKRRDVERSPLPSFVVTVIDDLDSSIVAGCNNYRLRSQNRLY